MKKLINESGRRGRGVARTGFAAAHADLVRVNYDPMYIVRADAPVQGKVGDPVGRRLGARADARRLRGHGHARRRLPGGGLHLAHARPDVRGHQGGRRRRRRAAHRQELHRRRPQLRDGRRPRRAPTASRWRPSSPTTTWPCRTASTRPAAAAWASPCSPRRSSGAAAEEGRTSPRSPSSAARVNAEGRSMGMALTSCTVPAAGKPTFELGDDEMEIGIGIHGEPGRERLPLASGARDRGSGSPTPILDDLPFASGDQRARLRQRHGRHAADRALPRLQRAAARCSTERGVTRSPAAWWARTSRRWRWPAARSRCCGSTTS